MRWLTNSSRSTLSSIAAKQAATAGSWSTAARTTDVTEKEMPVNYADRGLSYDFEGTTRDINVALDHKARIAANPLNDPDPDLLPGSANQAAPDGPDGEREQGYLWNAAMRAHEIDSKLRILRGSGALRTGYSRERGDRSRS